LGLLLEFATSLFDIYSASYFNDFNNGRVFFYWLLNKKQNPSLVVCGDINVRDSRNFLTSGLN
jgi:hypothetical protein